MKAPYLIIAGLVALTTSGAAWPEDSEFACEWPKLEGNQPVSVWQARFGKYHQCMEALKAKRELAEQEKRVNEATAEMAKDIVRDGAKIAAHNAVARAVNGKMGYGVLKERDASSVPTKAALKAERVLGANESAHSVGLDVGQTAGAADVAEKAVSGAYGLRGGASAIH